ncbi:hypothetical protein CHARACLAT_003536 [Characodon lateralis]|uniref:Uncharacterized protein n=1 Tax=Characodon lateralis TaxID=208331 RepID=A0ABU7D3T5_9TELE|nr:hypothetical protein [Characodon lateralis]
MGPQTNDPPSSGSAPQLLINLGAESLMLLMFQTVGTSLLQGASTTGEDLFNQTRPDLFLWENHVKNLLQSDQNPWSWATVAGNFV